jgi:hypothetical protein
LTDFLIISLFLKGNNYITVNFGATLELDENDLNSVEQIVESSKILVTSMVVKKEAAIHALKLAKKHNRKTQFNIFLIFNYTA